MQVHGVKPGLTFTAQVEDQSIKNIKHEIRNNKLLTSNTNFYQKRIQDAQLDEHSRIIIAKNTNPINEVNTNYANKNTNYMYTLTNHNFPNIEQKFSEVGSISYSPQYHALSLLEPKSIRTAEENLLLKVKETSGLSWRKFKKQLKNTLELPSLDYFSAIAEKLEKTNKQPSILMKTFNKIARLIG